MYVVLIPNGVHSGYLGESKSVSWIHEAIKFNSVEDAKTTMLSKYPTEEYVVRKINEWYLTDLVYTHFITPVA